VVGVDPCPDRLRDDRGSLLVELLVAAGISVVLLGAVGLSMVTTLSDSARTSARVDALDDATRGLDRLRTELRQALALAPAVTATTPASSLDVRRWTRLPDGSTARRWFRIACTATGSRAATRACRRTDLTSGQSTLLADGLDPAATAVFTLEPAVAPAVSGLVRLRLRTAATGASGGVEVRGAVLPRPCAGGPPAGSSTCPG
jgi:type II secretory pathway pseudopilin PulG